jgi:DNA polymerase elongation subunit (family B)
MKDRDPGNAPQSNDRIPYAYVITKGKPKLQGERVEHPEYIDEKKLKLDYLFYITNQIMKPSIQFLELLVENPQKLFDEYITRELNRRMGKKPVGAYFQKTKKNTDIGDIEILNNFKTKI